MTQDTPRTHPPLPYTSPALWLATWFGCGLIPKAPGTWGTLGALPFGAALLWFTGWPGLLAGAVLAFVIGLWAAASYEKASGTHDSGAIVIDEVAGMWLTLCVAQPTMLSFALAFLLFRVFDILKPWPVSWADKKLPGAWGVMADDILAGVYAALCLYVIQWGLNGF